MVISWQPQGGVQIIVLKRVARHPVFSHRVLQPVHRPRRL
jgi:hypothetical protein